MWPDEAIFLPLSDDGLNVDKILVFAACRDAENPTAKVRLEL
jgi:hypothetical protein